MKGKDRNIFLIIIAIVIALILLLFIFYPRQNSNSFSWRESYWEQSDQPYGTEVISKILESYFDDYDFEIVNNDIGSVLSDDSQGHKNYIFIGWEPYFPDSTFRKLADFVSRGNDAFFAIKDIPEMLSSTIFMTGSIEAATDSAFYLTEYGDTIWYQRPIYEFDTSTYSYFTTETISINFLSPAFKRDTGWSFEFRDWEEVAQYEWRYFFPGYLNRLHDFQPLGTIRSDNFMNYIRVPYGKGNFYVHINPIVFTNYFQIQERNVEYTSKVFSFLEPGDIIWDEASKTPVYGSEGYDFQNEQEGPLKYILSQQSLRWSWYVLLSGLVIFLIFRTKRMQKAIPVIETNENKSLEFIQTIGRMYFISKNHKLMSQQKMRLFLHFISGRYRIPTSKINDEFLNKLNLKSEISVADIKAIFSHYRYIENTTDVSSDDLIYLHQLLDSFYKTCK